MQSAFTLIFLPATFIFGATIGSFLNVVILRTHEGKSLNGRSSCPHCKHQLSTFDLIPILSFIFLNGKCRYCHHKLSLQYPLVELTTAILFMLVFLAQGQSLFIGCQSLLLQCLTPSFILSISSFIFNLFIISVLIIISVYDLKWGLIPDKIIIPASLVALVYQVLTFGCQTLSLQCQTPGLNFYLSSLIFNLATAFGIGLFFYLLIVFTKGKGMGGGDFKLSIFIGLIFSWPFSLLAIFLGFLTGALAAVMLLLTGKKGLKSTVPFGPFLALGAAIALLFGNQILELYLKTLGL